MNGGGARSHAISSPPLPLPSSLYLSGQPLKQRARRVTLRWYTLYVLRNVGSCKGSPWFCHGDNSLQTEGALTSYDIEEPCD